MTNDVVLVSLEKCDLARVVASDDMVEVRDGKLFVNQEEVGQVNEQAKKEIVKWRVDGGFLVDCGEDEFRAVLQTQIKGKEILNIRVRNF